MSKITRAMAALAATTVLGLGAGAAHATVYTVDLTGDASPTTAGNWQVVQADFGFIPITLFNGDQIDFTLTLNSSAPAADRQFAWTTPDVTSTSIGPMDLNVFTTTDGALDFACGGSFTAATLTGVCSVEAFPGFPVDPSDSFTVAGLTGTWAHVPEPSTWLLAILGLGLTGAALRQRRRVDALA